MLNSAISNNEEIVLDEPIPLIHVDEVDDQLIINEKALNYIKQLDGKLYIIAMAGIKDINNKKPFF